MGFGYWTDKHVDAERKLNLRAAIEKAAGSAEKLSDVRGLLAPILRDTLVGFNYAYYAPPGAQILYHQPGVRAQPRFRGNAGNVAHVARHRVVRHRLAVERRRPAGRIAVHACLMRWPKPNRTSWCRRRPRR